nr:fibropellin-1-like [Lytechinus pictus]
MQSAILAVGALACLLIGVSAQLDGCESDPCERGVCAPSQDQYICECPDSGNPPYYHGVNCEVGSFFTLCPGGHVFENNVTRSYANIPHSTNCFTLIGIPNAAYIEIQFSQFDIEANKDELAIGPGATADIGLSSALSFDNDARPVNGIVNITGSRAWLNMFTDPSITSGGYTYRVWAETYDCIPDPCQNGATCVDLMNDFECICPSGYTGKICDIELDFCGSGPCLNGGTCNADSNGYVCDCVAGWTGLRCDTNINECASDPCQNGATCVDGINEWACTCAAQYTGERCEISLNACGIAPCYNGATCINAGLDYICECVPGYTGDNCEIDINECTSLPCQNGATCLNQVNRYTCQCRQGFTGINCEEVGYCDLEGQWYNECNDRIIISLTSTGMILGHYSNNIGLLTGYVAPNVMVGYANQNCDFPSFGFVVSTDNGKSTTSWSGQCHLCGGEEVLYLTWTNTMRVSTCMDIKTATHIGQDRWTRYKQSQAPRENNEIGD